MQIHFSHFPDLVLFSNSRTSTLSRAEAKFWVWLEGTALSLKPTYNIHVDHVDFRSSFENKFTFVDPHIAAGEVWDVQIWLSPRCVSERFSILTGVFTLALTVKAYLTTFFVVCQVDFPDNIHRLIPCLIATC